MTPQERRRIKAARQRVRDRNRSEAALVPWWGHLGSALTGLGVLILIGRYWIAAAFLLLSGISLMCGGWAEARKVKRELDGEQ